VAKAQHFIGAGVIKLILRFAPGPADAERMALNPPYPRPPITEAVIELQFPAVLSRSELDRLRERMKSDYPTIENIENFQLSFQPSSVTATERNMVGFKMTSKNAVDLVLVQQKNLTSVRLAPYAGWDYLFGKTQENYQRFNKVVGRREISRIGVRYINRIDIPLAKIEGRDLYDFVRVGISVPIELAQSIGDYYINGLFVDRDTGMNIRIQGGTVIPVLLEHASILLDIEVYIDKNIPMREDDLWSKVSEVRAVKNRVFELSITDEARSLFQ
jgi:uncharacterized protein (TIGR04255 family)